MWHILSKRSYLWPQVRKQHLLKEMSCMACGTKKRLQVHHIEPLQINPDRELDPSNLITLCNRCHLVFGHLMDYLSWNNNVREDAMVYYNKVANRPYKAVNQNVSTIDNIFFDWYNKLYGLWRNYRS